MSSQIKLIDLRTENKVKPICIDETSPHFSWKFENYHDGFEQSAYQIVAATSPDKLDSPDLWDSGKVISCEPVNIQYQGERLTSRTLCYWKVRIWDEKGQDTQWSELACFRMGLLSNEDWKAKWIGYDKEVIGRFDSSRRYYVADDFDQGENELHLPPPPYLRKEFIADKPMKRACVYISALGLYELHLNGKKVGDAYLTPGWSDYTKRVYYDAYEIELNQGANAVGIILADGWYAGYVGLVSRHVWGDKPRVLAQLEIEYADGTLETVVTDDSWQAAYGAIREADILHGEKVDAQKHIRGWDMAGCKENCWSKPDVSQNPMIKLQARIKPHNRVIQEIEPILISRMPDGSLLYDMGKNLTGVACLKSIKETVGTEIVFNYATILNAEGDIDKRVYRSARAMDFYMADGSGNETFMPCFTFRGFRYLKISGLSNEPKQGDLKGMFISSDLRSIGEFACSDEVANNVFAMLKQTIQCGYMEVPMDCCERDERLGWGQDGNHSLRFGSYIFDISDFIRKWENDILDSQKADGSYGPTAPFVDMGDIGQFRGDIMADCGLQAPWVAYKMYGDTRILRHNYSSMKKYYTFMRNNSDRDMRNSIAGDWLQILANGYTDYIHGWGDTARDLIGTAFYAYGAYIMMKTAQMLELDEEAKAYEEQYDKICKAFRNTFELRGSRFRDHTQTGYSLALYFNLLSENIKPYVARYLYEDVKTHKDSMTGGVIGAAYTLDALSENGYHDTAVRVITGEEYPSYGYMLKMGGTTCWERWDSLHHLAGVHPHNMNSYNHIGMTSAGAWFFKKPAGITCLAPGFKQTKIEPYTDGDFQWVKASYESVYGKIGVMWEKKDGQTEYKIVIPPNVTATVVLPCAARYKTTQGLKLIDNENGKMSFSAKCGTHKATIFND